ncbi:MAG: nucleotide exchange factor GrpE [Chloroflexota bacterium]
MLSDPTPSPQAEQRLLQLNAQLDAMQSQLDRLATVSRLNHDQVAALTVSLTDPMGGEATREQLGQMAVQMESHHEQMESLRQLMNNLFQRNDDQLGQLRKLTERQEQWEPLMQSVVKEEQLENISQSYYEQIDALRQMMNGLSQYDEAQLNQLRQVMERQEQWEPLVRGSAKQDQVESLSQRVANTEQLDELLGAVKKLNRTQFKTNALSESKESQVTNAIQTLQSVVNRREEIQEDQVAVQQQQISENRIAARGEMAADLFPALDGLELALAKGSELLQRLREEQSHRTEAKRRTLTALLQEHKEPIDDGFWARAREMVGGSPNSDAMRRNEALDLLIQELANVNVTQELAGISAIEGWLEGLELVRDRFFKIFAAEGITAIPAEGQMFDPRVHVAVEAQTNSAVEPDTITAVFKTGYRQNRRVLRYAEVVVARGPEKPKEPNDLI